MAASAARGGSAPHDLIARAIVAASAILCLVAPGRAQRGQEPPRPPGQSPPPAPAQPPPAPQATFRSAIDVIRIDVSVFDRHRHPVRGLAQEDFTLLEEGQERPIVAFAPIDLPDAEEPPTAWKAAARPDVATNAVAERRLVAIVIDDATLRPGPNVLPNAKRIVDDVIDRLGPQDVAAVIFTRDNRSTQDFTSDRARLAAAASKMSHGFPDQPYYSLAALNTLEGVAKVLMEAPEQRKVLVFISSGSPVDVFAAQMPQQVAGLRGPSMMDRENALAVAPARDRVFREATRANVNVYAFDPCGLRPAQIPGQPSPDPCVYDQLQIDSLLSVAEGTGGHATINTADFTAGVDQMFLENSSYYLIGYRSSHPPDDGTTRRIEIRVNRPGLRVRTRTVYDSVSARAAVNANVLPSAASSISGVLPKTDLPMRASLVPFASPADGGRSAVAIVLGIEQPDPPARVVETFELIASAFDPQGRPRGSQRQSSRVTLREGAAGETARFELVSQMTLSPGRYRMRLGAYNASRNLTGSVHMDLDVPDFRDDPLSLSGIVLTKEPPLKSAQNGVAALVPIVPTTVRTFERGERVTGFVRVYRGAADGNRPPPRAPVSMKIAVLDPRDGEVFSAGGEVVVSRMGPMYAADYTFEVPVNRVSIGDHLLIVEASTDPRTRTDRRIPFAVR